VNAAHVHLLVNHVPIIGELLALPLLGLALWRRDVGSTLAACLVVAIAGAGGAAADLTGDGAADAVWDLPGTSKGWLHEHEERGEKAAIVAGITGIGAIAVGVATARRGSPPMAGLAAVGVAALASAGLLVWTGAAGGYIRHVEFRDEAPEPPAPP
jgi:hypothetical protein